MIRYSKLVFMIMTVPAVLAAQSTAAVPRTQMDWNAILRNTISLTGLQGSNGTNVIPAEASAFVYDILRYAQ